MNADLVAAGIARVYRQGRRYEDLRYVEQQREPMRLSRGLWAYDMVDPAVFRARRRAERVVADGPPGECAIKGNIGAGGRIYHLPGTRDYARTSIRVEQDERWFCSESEAQDAGWRAPRR